MKQTQKHYNEFQKRFKAMNDEELLDAFNRDVGNPGWVSARGEYHAALRVEFENRGYDYLRIGDKGVSIKKMGKMKQYLRFKKWIEQERIQTVLPWVNLGIALLIVGFLILLNINDVALNYVLGIYTKSVSQPMTEEIEVPTSAPVYMAPTVAQPVYKAPTPDPDPIVTCNINSNCGGGSVQLKRNACSQTTCCQIGPQWLFYNSKDKCAQDQSALTAIHNTQVAPQTGSASQPLVTCVLSWGTYQLTQSSCDLFKSSVKPSEPTVTCALSYGTFQLSQSVCNSAKSTDNLPKPTPFQLAPVNTNIVVPTSMQIIMPTPRTCTTGGINSYGVAGVISVPCN